VLVFVRLMLKFFLSVFYTLLNIQSELQRAVHLTHIKFDVSLSFSNRVFHSQIIITV